MNKLRGRMPSLFFLYLEVKMDKLFYHHVTGILDTREGWISSCLYHVNKQEDWVSPAELFDILKDAGVFVEVKEEEKKI